MPTQCNTKPLEFEPQGRRRVVATFRNVSINLRQLSSRN